MGWFPCLISSQDNSQAASLLAGPIQGAEGRWVLPTGQFGGDIWPGSWQSINASSSHHCQSLLHHPPATEMMFRCRERSLGKEEKEKKHRWREKLGFHHLWTAVIFRCEFPGPVELFCSTKSNCSMPQFCIFLPSVLWASGQREGASLLGETGQAGGKGRSEWFSLGGTGTEDRGQAAVSLKLDLPPSCTC